MPWVVPMLIYRNNYHRVTHDVCVPLCDVLIAHTSVKLELTNISRENCLKGKIYSNAI